MCVKKTNTLDESEYYFLVGEARNIFSVSGLAG